jgi:hypothetical protein
VTRFHYVLFGLLVALVTTVPALAQSVSLVGSLQTTSGGPVVGASVYVTRIKDAQGNSVRGSEVGPVVSSGRGQFVFYNLPAGQYTVRIVVSKTVVWQGTVRAPGQLHPIVLR